MFESNSNEKKYREKKIRMLYFLPLPMGEAAQAKLGRVREFYDFMDNKLTLTRRFAATSPTQGEVKNT